MKNRKPQDKNAIAGQPLPSDVSGIQMPPVTLGATLRRLGPGVIIAGVIVGSGELIATTKVGAEAGFWLLWLIIIGCIIKVFTQIEFGRYTITWNQTPLKALDSVPGPRLKVNWLMWYWVILTALGVGQLGGIVGGVGQALAISRPLTARGIEYNHLQDELIRAKVDLAMAESRRLDNVEIEALQLKIGSLNTQIASLAEPKDVYIWATILAIVTSVLLTVGRYWFIEIAATILVSSFTFATILTLLMLQTKPDWAITSTEVMEGLSFRLPPTVEGIKINPIATALAAFGIIGMGAGELIQYPYWCLEKGYAKFTGLRDDTAEWAQRARGWIRVLKIDAWVSMVIYTFATVAFYLLGAAVLGRTGLNPKNSDMIRTLTEMYVPVFGQWAPMIFLFGAFAVLYSTFFLSQAGNVRVVADALGLFGLTDGSEAAKQKWIRILGALWPLMSLAVFLFIKAPVAMVLASGICQSIMLPMLGGAALYFRYRRQDKRLTPGRIWDMMLWLSFVGFAIVGAWALFSTLSKFMT